MKMVRSSGSNSRGHSKQQKLSLKFRAASLLLSCSATTVTTTHLSISGITSQESSSPSSSCRSNGFLRTRDSPAPPSDFRVSVECSGCRSISQPTSSEADLPSLIMTGEKAKSKKKDRTPSEQNSTASGSTSPTRAYVYYFEENKERMRMRKKTRGERSSSCSEERSEGKSEKTTVEKRKAVNGFAVVKQSEDPYEDFRNSMAEMIVEQRLFRARELGSLLMSYLSLNSPRHHPAIIEAFSELRLALHGS